MATILFLEDENMIREVLSEYMVVAGHEVVTCERGDEAIKLIEEGEPFDLAVLDIRVPGATGFDVLQAIKSWKNHEDFVLSYLCKTVINRKFPKIIYSSTPFSDDLVQEKVRETNLHFGIENGDLLVDNIERNLLPYDKTKQPIYLLRNDMEKVALEQAGSQILSMNINEKTTRYILSFPKEIS